MIFPKLKREFPQFAHLEANRVSQLTHAQRVQIANKIWNSDSINSHQRTIIHRILSYTVEDRIFHNNVVMGYQAMTKKQLQTQLYKALKVYYNE